MCLDHELDTFIERLKKSEALRDVQIIKAYPYVTKPTRLNHAVITVSPSEIKGESISIGQEDIFASCTIDADIYVPVEFGSPRMWEYIRYILLAQMNGVPTAVSVSRVAADDKLSCYTAKCSLTYNGVLGLDDI